MNKLYPSYREYCLRAFHEATLPPDAVTIVVCGVDDSYEYSDAHQTVDALGDSIILPAQELTNATFDLGIIDGDDIKWVKPDVAGLTLKAVILVAVWGEDGDESQLMAYFDSVGTQLPQLLNGYDFTMHWHANGIFRI